MRTKPKIHVGTDSFADLLLSSNVFVDKSMLIQEFLEESVGKVVLVTRPRRWGKSLNMDMLRCFLEIEVDAHGVPLPQAQCLNHKLFAGGEVALDLGDTKLLEPLKISHDPASMKFQGQFPVISLGLKDVKGSAYQEIEEGIKKQIAQLYKKHRYLKQYIQPQSDLLDEDQKEQLSHYFKGAISQEDLKDSLRFLSELLYMHFGKPVYVLIDEYDTPINSAYLAFKHNPKASTYNPEAFEEVLQLFRALFGATFKSNPYLKQGLITGILRIAKANLFSDLNNVQEYTLLDKRFASSYGFTQPEVDTLLDQVPLRTDREEIQRWYNGYTFGGEIIYNPWSIMCCLAREGELDHYWLDSGGTQLIDAVLLSDELQQDLQTLVRGGVISSPIMKQISFEAIQEPMGLYSLLLFSGYLNPAAVQGGQDLYRLSIPNNEVKYIYEQRLLGWVSQKLRIDPSRYYSLTGLLAEGKVEVFGDRLQELLDNSTSFHQTGGKVAELFYSGFMLGLLSSLSPYYVIESERESGMGRPDAVLIPRVDHGDQALVIEYKVSKEVEGLTALAEEGLVQIGAKGYGTQAKAHGHVKQLLQICLAFCGKQVALKYAQVML